MDSYFPQWRTFLTEEEKAAAAQQKINSMTPEDKQLMAQFVKELEAHLLGVLSPQEAVSEARPGTAKSRASGRKLRNKERIERDRQAIVKYLEEEGLIDINTRHEDLTPEQKHIYQTARTGGHETGVGQLAHADLGLELPLFRKSKAARNIITGLLGIKNLTLAQLVHSPWLEMFT